MDEVVSTDSGTISVSLDQDDLEIRPGKLEARGISRCAAVGDMEFIEIEISRDKPIAADPCYECEPFRLNSCPVDGPDQGLANNAAAAAAAPLGGKP
jgi:hypothetical protein